MPVLHIPRPLFAEMAALCEKGYPEEVCGILLGRTEGNQRRVEEIFPAENLNRARAEDRYELDPAAFQRADTLALEQKLDILGFYHSHPDCPPQSSATDTERAWEGYSYLIVAVAKGRLDSFRSWRLNESVMEEEEVRLCPK